MRYLFDSSAWIEYLDGGKSGEAVSKILEDENNEIYSVNIIVAEVVSKSERKKVNVDIAYNSIISNSELIEIDSHTAKKAGLLHAEAKKKNESFSLIDSFIITAAYEIGAKLVTKDSHFKGFKNVIFI
jgi:predicted nucleic acid-binding protein